MTVLPFKTVSSGPGPALVRQNLLQLMKSNRLSYTRFGALISRGCFTAALLASLPLCSNNPYSDIPQGQVLLTAMNDDPRTLDPARVGDTVSNSIASNLHDTPYEYHYLLRPLRIVPAMAVSMPVQGSAQFNGKTYQTFGFTIKKGLRYADDACFAGGRGREIKIDDIILSVKRAADTSLDPFGLPLLAGKVLGFDDYSAALEKTHNYNTDIPGVRRLDDYTIQILLTEDFPQIIYFFSLVMGSPVPRECVDYYTGQNGRPTYNQHPATSGPFYLKEWHTNYRIILARSPVYRTDDMYPSSGNPGDEEKGLLQSAGMRLPIVDEVRFQIIKSTPPFWTLFKQGYLDRAGIPSEVYNQVMQGQYLSDEYRELGIKLDRETDVATFWWQLNLEHPIFKNNKLLRHALSLCIDRKELIERFYNNRGVISQSIIPPGIEGYTESYQNPYSRYDIDLAKDLLARAGYPGGRDPATGKPLEITLVAVASQGSTSVYRFYIDQFARAGINLKIEQLDWPTVLEKKAKKNFQIVVGGWHADYPDPQNFLQLLYSPNIASSYNEGSYRSAEFDRLYEKMKNMRPGNERVAIIQRMLEISNEDAPNIYLHHPVSYGLSHQWLYPLLPHPIGANQLKFRRIDRELRDRLVAERNRPPFYAYLAIFLTAALLVGLAFQAVRQYKKMGAL